MKRLATILIAICCAIAVNAQQHKLWYSKPATKWLEALPVGNSHLGAMVFGGTDVEQIQLNEETFWSGSPHDNNSRASKKVLKDVRKLIFEGKEQEASALIDRYFFKGPHGQKYLSLGDLKLSFDYKSQSAPTNYRRELSLAEAVNTTSFDIDGVHYERNVFASQADNAVVIQISSSIKKALNFKVDYVRYEEPVKGDAIAKHEFAYNINNVEHEGIPGKLKAEVRVKVVADGKVIDTDNGMMVANASTATIIITAATNYVNYKDISGNPLLRNSKTRLRVRTTRPC